MIDRVPTNELQNENYFFEIVKARMLMKLDDRSKFIFLYVFDMGHTKQDAAGILNVTPSIITRYVERIRVRLSSFKESDSAK